MKPRTFITLFLAAVITSISATPTALAAGNNMNVFAPATTTQPVNNATPGNGNSDPGLGELLQSHNQIADPITAVNKGESK